jgi:hypothetical protein
MYVLHRLTMDFSMILAFDVYLGMPAVPSLSHFSHE